MAEYWLISAPGDKTMQQTWETMNNVTSKQNNLCENFKFHIPDLKVGTLDQLVGLSDDLGKLDAYVEQTTRKISAYLGDVLEDQRDKLYENLLANNSSEGSDEQSAPTTPAEPPLEAPFEDGKRQLSIPDDISASSRPAFVNYQRQYSSGQSQEGGPTTSSSRYGSLTNSSSSACSGENQHGPVVCSCTTSTTPTTPCSPPTVICQFFDDTSHPAPPHPDPDGWWDEGKGGKKHKSKHRKSPKPPASPASGSHSRKASRGSHQFLQATDDTGLSCGAPESEGYSAPEMDQGPESGFEWRWFHRRKHSHKSRSRSSSHLFGGGSGHGSGHSLVGTSSCCGGGRALGNSRHNRRPSSPDPDDDESDVYGGLAVLDPVACPHPPPHPGGGPPASSTALARNGLHLRKQSTVANKGHQSRAPLAAVINPDDLTSYITRFQWDLAKYPTKQSLRNIADIISKQVGQIDADLKTKSAAYNNLKGNLQNLEKKQTGSLLTRNLADLVKKEHFILDSEYLTTLLVIVPKANINDWNAHYEKITDMIVPRSSQLIMQDSDYALVNVTLFKKVVDEFKLHARERKFVVREFVYNEEELAAGKNEITKLVTDKKKQFGPLVRWLKVNFSETFCAWIHVKALRVFVESVLRYGLPVNFQAILIHPNKKSTKRLRDVLQQLYGHLDGSGSSAGGNADNVDIPGLGFGQSEYFPYVYYKLNIDMIETKV